MCVGVSIARTGEMVYGPGETPLEVGPDGKVIIQRDAKEVFRPETIASFEGKAVTIQHPESFVSPENWTELAKGILQNVKRGTADQENDLVADLLVTDKVAIALVKNGLREVSCGYEAEYTQVGIGRGVQTDIIGNHLALVESGRAGSAYAIHDHKGKGSIMKLGEQLKALFVKTGDEAAKIVDGNMETPEKKPGLLVMGNVDASTQPTQSQPAYVQAKDFEEFKKEMKDWMGAMDAKYAKDAAEKEEEKKAKDAKEKEDEEETGDASCDDDDDDMTGDTAARIEILVPGMKAQGRDAKAKALLAAYATKDGKTIIDQFTGGKLPDIKNSGLIDSIFIGASEVLKVKRNSDLAGTKTSDASVGTPKSGPKTPEEINEMNAKFYGGKK